MRNYNAARASGYFLSLMSGSRGPMCMDPRVLEERAQFAAAMGNREAQMFLRVLNMRSPSRSPAVTPRSSAPRERDPFLRKLLRK